ncbi:MAG: cytochrome c biogenesis protein CcsA, partial [Fimbriimonadaceae bacterium]|nr:cytochrome c biogenesis protein CcsA [Alphaproteobacteria bacterium]
MANIWAGDEGTLLLLSLLGMGCALLLSRYRGLAGPGAYLLSAFFILGALIWDPFRQTPPDMLAETPFRGMNAHLTRVWMVVHPPLVFLSYLLVLAPWGAMAEALAFGRGDWKQIAAIWSRAAWFLLSAGIAFGMWWAYEDFTYGTLWHWDPVQTSIFATWSFLTALLHAQRRYQMTGVFMILHPLLGLLSATSIVLAMAVTRNPELVSSHRYVGETSLWLLLAIAGLIGTSTLLAWISGLRRAKFRARIKSERHAFLWVAIILFVLCGIAATAQITLAYRAAYLGLPRPDDLKPFFESLASFSPSQEMQALRNAFAQWDIDNFGMNRWLTPLCSLIALVGGHYFIPRARHRRWVITSAVILIGAVIALWVHPMSYFFTGTGLTSGKTVALFPWLDFLAVTIVYLIASVSYWAIISGRRGRSQVRWTY